MNTTISLNENKQLTTLEALWTLIQSQSKSVQTSLAKRLNAKIKEDKRAKIKMTEEEFYAKIDNAKNEANDPAKCYTQQENESIEDFLNRLLCTPSAL